MLMKNIKIGFMASLMLFVFLSIPFGMSASENSGSKDVWPLKIKEDMNVALIGTYGEYRYPGHYHLAIDIHSHKGEYVYNNADGILLECIKIHDRAGYRIIIGDPVTLEGREFTHVEPTRKFLQAKPGTSLIKKGEYIGNIADYGNDGEDWNDHLHYAYVRIKQMVNKEGDALNVIEGLEHPLNRLEITPEIREILRDAPPQFVEPIMFIPDGGKKGEFKNGPVYGKVDILVHAFDRMGRSWGLGKYSPGPYEFEWRIVKPSGFADAGGVLKLDGKIPLIRPNPCSNYIENEMWAGDFQFLVTNGMIENGYWFTNESKSNSGIVSRSNADAKYPDGKYTIEVTIREHPALGTPQRFVTAKADVVLDNFRD
jgi:hypothetical protein